jgi:hypothetical protein
VLLWLGICALPIYFWSSGGLQVTHYLIAAGCLFFMLRNGIGLIDSEVLLIVLALYILLRECVSVMWGADITSLLPFLYMSFSVITFNAFRRWAVREKNIEWLNIGFLMSAAIAASGVIVKGYGFTVDAEGGRAIGTFNNPNQLGYFAVCIAAIAALLQIRGQIGRKSLATFFLAATFLAVASLSKAAMISVAFAALFIGFSISRSRASFFIGVTVSLVLVAIAFAATDAGYFDSFKFVARLRDLGADSDDSWTGRGYGILSQVNASQLLFGFGSSGVEAIVGHEVHSTIASFFASYGVIGGGLFSIFMLQWIRRLYVENGWVSVATVVLPPFLYGITHNGSRFTIFWILLGVSFARGGVLLARRSDDNRRIRADGRPAA